MEKYYIVSPGSEVYKEYMKYEKFVDAISKAFSDFADQHGIKATKFYTYTSVLHIFPEKEDIERFGDSMTKTEFGRFKKSSELSQKWVAKCKELGLVEVRKPFVPFLFNAIAKSSWRLFSIKDDVYCTYESTSKFDAPECFTEIKASEFYKIMEDNNVELN